MGWRKDNPRMQSEHALRRWDLYCRVIDNLGDAGVCWRLAADLASRGQIVRLVIDDEAPLRLIAPAGAPGVTVHPWPGPEDEPGDVVIEAFGCELPASRISAIGARAAQGRPPVWLNLEYLSAESYVERSHRLPSPQTIDDQPGPTKWFFYPGFTPRTGGLLREASLAAARGAFQRDDWLAQHGLHVRPGERVVSLFCYENTRIPELLSTLAEQPTLLLLTPGHAQQQVPETMPLLQQLEPALRVHRLPWLDQAGYDRLLWSCDLNFVRGEDSLVRAHWAGVPFVWQIYPQEDGVHAQKLQALLQRMQAPPELARLWWAWNGLSESGWPVWPDAEAWARITHSCRAWQAGLEAQGDLCSQVLGFVQSKQPNPGTTPR